MSDQYLQAELEVTSGKVKSGVNQSITSLQALEKEIQKVQTQLQEAASSPEFNRLATKFNSLSRNIQTLGGKDYGSVARKPVKELGDEVVNTGNKFNSLTGIMNRSMHGVADLFIAPGRAALIFANDLPVLVDKFRTLKAEQKALAAEGKAAASSTTILAEAFNPLGLAVGLGAIALIDIIPHIIEYTNNVHKAVDANELMAEALPKDSNYQKAISNVEQLTEHIKLAKEGFINKEDVLKEYNTTIGKTTGQVDNLTDAENQLIKNKDAYIQMMAQKAVASYAYEQAAKKVVEAQAKQLNTFKVPTLGDSFEGLMKWAFGGGDSDLFQQRIDDVKTLNKDAGDLINIAKKAEELAAKITSEHNWSFAGSFGGKSGSGKKAKENIDPIVKANQDLLESFADIDRRASAHLIHFSDVSKLRLEAIKKAIEALTKAGAPIGILDEARRRLETSLTDKSLANVEIPLHPEIKWDAKPAEWIAKAGENLKKGIDIGTMELQKIAQIGAIGLAEGIGAALGSGDFSQLGQAFLGSLGQAIEQFGKMVVEKALEVAALQNSLLASINTGNWPAAAAIGLAIVAAGAALAAVARNGASAETSNQGSFSRSSSGYAYAPSYSGGAAASTGARAVTGGLQKAVQSGFDSGKFDFKLLGTDIVGSYDRTKKRQGQ